MENEVKLYPRKRKLLFYFVLGLFLLMMAVGTLPILPNINILVIVFINIYILLMFAATIYPAYLLIKRKPIIVLTKNGIYADGVGFVAWPEIQDVFITTGHRVGLKFTNYNKVFARQSHFRQFIMKINRNTSPDADAYISSSLLALSAEGLTSIISNYMARISIEKAPIDSENPSDSSHVPFLIGTLLSMPAMYLSLFILGPLDNWNDELTWIAVIALELIIITVIVAKFLPKNLYPLTITFGFLSATLGLLYFIISLVLFFVIDAVLGIDGAEKIILNPMIMLVFFGLLGIGAYIIEKKNPSSISEQGKWDR